ncbi:enoyl-CoA hydratase/isomerase family protein [Rhodococcus sp. 06-156-3C]|uniref:enoyl-CoA hydratase/isomerase family protein n=1 Tax=Nocardiaceae TaxID=85025 RepID=UPI00052306A1|nr:MULTISPECIES: enoyl-CoA hydratase/isomerase family protein [Rhodococcus]OZD13096.1 enoyl-CoA hydratase/isomerase family protein [Rhodococcus sp. 06-156-4a]OZD17965.1 enoyl-CoA hydratase/isomerase family protein [Rhodococcus sp. 06-156-3C]OZD20689.1 enoyl-CoA hydratase/isomerase family protein [Rhodococcus sp. 06-156-4C]OZD30592.1 enoyl-CoA hydratase/isomerase family protein [Rhodococcus sp. 06-156-3b]OZD32635.1 enoyl-CoA hydratase/isomerase family protein [Rhodococcus sp. 06-156-3]
MTEFVTLDVIDGVGTIRLARPPMNALNRQVQTELRAAVVEATQNSSVAAVVVRGSDKVFAAGADVKELADLNYDEISRVAADLQFDLASISQIPKPTVAAINGYALGGGLEIALSADYRIAAVDAKLGVPEILLGVIPGGGGTQRLARLIGPSKAKNLMYTGRFVGADEAFRIGLVDEVVASADVYDTALRWASQFASGPAQALAAVKASVDRGLDTDLDQGLAVERDLFCGLFETEDRRIGMSSFMENGPGKATFVGR